MSKPILLFLILLISCALGAQVVPVPLKPEVQRPILFRDEPAGRLVWFFYTEKSTSSRRYLCAAVETDTAAHSVLRKGPEGHWDDPDEMSDNPFRQVSSHAAAGDYFVLLTKKGHYLCARVSGADLSIRSRGLPEITENLRYLTAASFGDHTVIVFTEKRKRNTDLLHVFRVQADSISAHQSIELQGEAEKMADKDFIPVVAQDLLELSPQRAALPLRAFIEGDFIRIVEDVEPRHSRRSYTRIFTLDVATAALQVDTFEHGLVKREVTERATSASCVLEGKLFQLLAHEDYIHLTVRSLRNRSILREHHFTESDPLEYLNAPVTVPGAFQREKSIGSSRKLFGLMSWVEPFLFVRHTDDGYLLHLGGYRYDGSTGTAVGLMFGVVGGLALAASGWSPENVVSTYMLLDDRSYVLRSQPKYLKTLLQRCADTMHEYKIQGKDQAQGLFQVGEVFYLGRSKGRGRDYELIQVGGL